MGRVTLQTIADRVGVSRMTVSNAFSRPDQLSARLRDQILAVADQLGYVGPDPTARALASGTAGAVGLLLSDIVPYALTDEIAMQFISGIADELGASGLALTLLSAASRDGVVQARDVAIDGALVYSCDPDSSAVGWLMRRRLPLVFVDQAPAPGIPSVNVDDRLGAQAAARYLVDLGHRAVAIVTTGYGGDFGIITNPLDTILAHAERQRMLGWLEALGEADIEPIVVRQPHADPQDNGYDVCRQSSIPAVGPRGSCVSPTPSRVASSALFVMRACASQRTFRSSDSTTTPSPGVCSLLLPRCARTLKARVEPRPPR